MNKFSFLILALGMSLGCQAQNAREDKNPPNILFIMSDDHTTQGFGIYGSRLANLNPTPVIDEFAAESMVFDNAFCNNSICTPSRASILTGQFPQTNRVLDLDDHLPPARQYLPIEMNKLGYQTAVVGKWHLREEPARFDYYQILPVQGRYMNPSFIVKGNGEYPNNIVEYQGHSTDVITDIALDWLEKKRDETKPFFFMLHYKAPHDMFEFAPRYADYLKGVEIPEPASMYSQPYFGSEATRGANDSLIHWIGTSVSARHAVRNYVQEYVIDSSQSKHSENGFYKNNPTVNHYLSQHGDKKILSANEATHISYQEYVKRFLRCVKGIDDNLKRVFTYLKENGLWENTIVIYTSDQGFMLGEHDYIDKRWMYDESMRIPLIVHYPKMIDAGRTDAMVSNVDFAPTLLELAGGEAPGYMQGQSFLPVLKGKKQQHPKTAVYYRYWMHLMHHDIPAHFGIRTKDYKLIFYYGLPFDMSKMGEPSMPAKKGSYPISKTPVAWEFYDLRNDPHELHNRYDEPAYQHIIADLKERLREKREKLNETDKEYPHIQAVIEANWER